MKIRQGFVSNSSSSSFIIAISKESSEKCEHCGRGGTSLLKFFTDDFGGSYYGNDDSVLNATGYYDIERTILDYYVCEDDKDYTLNNEDISDGYREGMKKAKQAEKEGKTVLYITLDYHDILGKFFLNDPDVEVLYEAG